MSELRDAFMELQPRTKRRLLWEINAGWHCSIIGTCLSLGDLRVLARKFRYRITDPDRKDLHLHSTFVQKCSDKNHASKLLNKLLDRRHANAIRRFREAAHAAEVMEIWREYYDDGNIPGPFWAAMSHPLLDQETGVMIYGDVHMASHLVGASNRADLASLHHLQQDVAAAQEKLARDKRRHYEKLAERDGEVAVLQTQVTTLRAALARIQTVKTGKTPPDTSSPEVRPDIQRKIGALRQNLLSTKNERDSLVAENAQIKAMVPRLESEVASLEQALAEPSGEASKPVRCINLDGRCLLYVGGRTTQVCRLRDLVSRWNGSLLHHDGGLEKSLEELTRSVAKADAVFFPTDCISHNAALRVKDLCRQSMKPFVPLRTSGIGSFVAGLESGLKETSTSLPAY